MKAVSSVMAVAGILVIIRELRDAASMSSKALHCEHNHSSHGGMHQHQYSTATTTTSRRLIPEEDEKGDPPLSPTLATADAPTDKPIEPAPPPPPLPIVPQVDSSTGKVFDGNKIREFTLARANLRQTTSQDLPFENDFKDKCTKWGVVTTIFDPTEAISRVSKLPEWCCVVVADTKTPTNYMETFETMGGAIESTFFFSEERQKTWEQMEGPIGDFVRTMPWRHFGRKNLGYLFAILHGAEFFFDFDDDNYIKLDDDSGLPVEILPSTTTLENVTVPMLGPTAFNHHPLMKPSIPAPSWARGFPLEYIKDEATQGSPAFTEPMPFVSRSNSIGVIQFLADGNPDVDANHRLMRPLPVTFDNTQDATNVAVPKHAYSPYNAQASIHTQPALWATLLPTTVPGRVSDIWRSYFAQCIFADADLRLVFAPPKIEQIRNDHNILGDLTAEHDLYTKSGKLIDFLSEWDSPELALPQRVEQLWIDLYERSYIEVGDVVAMQKWLEALITMGYQFPDLKPRIRNVAVMGQFNYADFPNSMTQIMMWSQKMRERFQTTIAAAPLSDAQVAHLQSHRVDALQAKDYKMKKRGHLGFYNPMSNLMRTLLRFSNSSTIEAVLYAHDDALLNVTELSEGKYPFPTDKVIANRKRGEHDNAEYVNLRSTPDREVARKSSHRVFPNGTITDADKTIFVSSSKELMEKVPDLHGNWNEWLHSYCAPGQQQMAMDPEFAKYLEPDGSAWFPLHTQSDFLMVPTKYAGEFAQAANLHLKHNIWIECAHAKIVDILREKSKAPVRLVRLCTGFGASRGSWKSLETCKSENVAVFHPFKIGDRFDEFWLGADAINFPFEKLDKAMQAVYEPESKGKAANNGKAKTG
ncbi:unnamed protein product [Cylindrotheca closterium]|uniref:Uncharacterized protein n=1 Tax=Cylindrotheca closterium TaxID=2856 RepID=A0AAD2GDN9_9STRA|nr:unnamed protein product [Cylindrotheca closterium]